MFLKSRTDAAMPKYIPIERVIISSACRLLFLKTNLSIIAKGFEKLLDGLELTFLVLRVLMFLFA